MSDYQGFICDPVPDHPGWLTWSITDPELFNGAVMGQLIARTESDRTVRVRMLETARHHGNAHGNLHGGVTLSLIDISFFAAVHFLLNADAASAVTLDVNTQFVGAARIGMPVDAVCEVMKETGRLVFLRGTVEQDGATTASFMGTVRKLPRK